MPVRDRRTEGRATSLERHSIILDGHRREFLLGQPAGRPSAVVLSLHGSRSGADGQVRLSRMDRLTGVDSVVVAFPQAVVRSGFGFEWDHEADTPFLARLAAELLERYPTPHGHVTVAGMSGGARMACHFAARHAEMVAAVGAVAGLRAPRGAAPSRPVPMLAFHGLADRVNPYAGSGTDRWDESVPDAARGWAQANGLPVEPTVVAASGTLTRTTYGEPGEPGEVTLWTSRDAGHTWPGGRLGFFLRLLLGRTSTEIDATAEIAGFAMRHSDEP
jgi:polyhydroxybutyrate depolymerase